MTLAVDTEHLLADFIPHYEEFNNKIIKHVGRSRGRCLKVDRVSVYGIVTHDAASRAQFDGECGYYLASQQQAALDWQAEEGDDEDELEVFHHLKHIAGTTKKLGVGSSRRKNGGVESKADTTTLLASVQSPTFTSSTQHRPPSSFRRYSFRLIQETEFIRYRTNHHRSTHSRKVFPDIHSGGCFLGAPRIISADAEAHYESVIWLVQLDFVDLSSQSLYSQSSPHKRRRTINPFHYVSPTRDEGHTARAQHRPAPEAKRFEGVRFRPDHTRWVAEMKPPKSKNKVSFGEFRSQIEAACVVDVAFYHYGKPLNFPDFTPRILSSRPPSAGLSAEATLEVVKNQTEWMKSRLSSLPSANRSASDTNSGLRPFSAIESSLILVGIDEADDAVSQPELVWPHALMPEFGMAEGQETRGVADGSGDWPQSSTTQWCGETAYAHDPSGDFGMSPEHFGGVLTTGTSSQLIDYGGFMKVGYSAAPSVFSRWSPEAFPKEAADGSWEQDIAFVERD